MECPLKLKQDYPSCLKPVALPDRILIGWMHTFAKKNWWRVVANDKEIEDLYQEGYMVYAKLQRVYGSGLKPAHFMALFQRAYKNRIHDMAQERTKRRVELTEADMWAPGSGVLVESPLARLIDAEHRCDLTEILMVIADAPNRYIKELLTRFLSDDAMELADVQRVRPDGSKESLNDMLCRVLGYKPAEVGDLVAQTKDYLYSSLRST